MDRRPEHYLWLVGRKTCWYSTVPLLRVAAIVGFRGRAPLDELSRLGFLMGVAFLIRDDLLDVEGTDDPLGDIREGKRTLMLIHLLGSLPELERVRLVEYLDRLDLKGAEKDASWVLDLMKRYGGLDFAAEYAKGIADAAAPGIRCGVPSGPKVEARGVHPADGGLRPGRTW